MYEYFIIIFIFILCITTALSYNLSGGWECKNMDAPYGSRCVDIGPMKRDECEANCLDQSELFPHHINLIRFMSNIKMPFSIEFLKSLDESNKDYHKFLRNRGYRTIYGLLQKSANFRIEFFEKMFPDKQIGIFEIFFDKDKFSIASGDIIDVNDLELYAYGNDIDYFRITIQNPPHANSLIIDHINKKTYHIEPHIGSIDEDKWYIPVNRAVEKFVEPLNYELDSTTTCPVGLQSVTGDSLCFMWELFISTLAMLNPDINLSEILNYLIKTQGAAKNVLKIFAYYCHTLKLKLYTGDHICNFLKKRIELYDIHDKLIQKKSEIYQQLSESVMRLVSMLAHLEDKKCSLLLKPDVAIFAYLVEEFIQYIKEKILAYDEDEISNKIEFVKIDINYKLRVIETLSIDLQGLAKNITGDTGCTIL